MVRRHVGGANEIQNRELLMVVSKGRLLKSRKSRAYQFGVQVLAGFESAMGIYMYKMIIYLVHCSLVGLG